MSSDPFDGVLGRRRGSTRNVTDEVSLSPVELARRLVRTLARSERPLVQRILLEQQLAADLGLELRHGFWTETDGDERWALSAIYFDDEFLRLQRCALALASGRRGGCGFSVTRRTEGTTAERAEVRMGARSLDAQPLPCCWRVVSRTWWDPRKAVTARKRRLHADGSSRRSAATSGCVRLTRSPGSRRWAVEEARWAASWREAR
jgi:hypothetical protein